MAGNILGQSLKLMSFGESHGLAIGGIVDGVPPNIPFNLEALQGWLDRRRPGQKLTTPRNEKDHLQILSGVFEGKTLGTPIGFLVMNTDQKSKDYDPYKHVFRPGHGDYTYQEKYGIRDHRGGGRSSARTTISLVVGGAIGAQVLHHLFPGIRIKAGITQLGPHKINPERADWSCHETNIFNCPDPFAAKEWGDYIKSLMEAGSSCGAVIEAHVNGLPSGLGEPLYDRLDADLAKVIMGINAVKAVEIGDGFAVAGAAQGYDEMSPGLDNPFFESNRAGGILAGISTGQPIIIRAAFKPTSSTRKTRKSVDDLGQKVELDVVGRHDPCVAMRAIPIVEAAIFFTLADHLLRWRGQCGWSNKAEEV